MLHASKAPIPNNNVTLWPQTIFAETQYFDVTLSAHFDYTTLVSYISKFGFLSFASEVTFWKVRPLK
jgi:hypothetical protein